jgi:hypothetical protein
MTGAMPTGGAPAAGPGESTARKEMISAMPVGDYYIVALDDLDMESARDPETLQQLAHSATRVSLIEGVPAEVSLRRLKLHDITQDR